MGARSAYLSAFVSPSWTTRKAARSSPAGQRAPLAGDVQLDRQAGLLRALDERADPGHRRLRGARAVLDLLVAVQDAEQAPHLRERLAAGALDLRGGGHRALGVALEDPPRAARLHDHHADAVGDDVVHLAREPAALVGRRAQRLQLVRLLLAQRGLVQLLGQPRAGAHARAPASQPIAPNDVGKM